MSASASPAFAGKDWSSTLIYAHYVGKHIVHREFYTANHLAHLPNGIVPPPCAPDALKGKITKITAFAIDLGGNNVFDLFKNMLTHHFVKVDTDKNYSLVLEKNKKCIQIQSCETSAESSPAVVVARTLGVKRGVMQGVKRNRPSTLQVICIDANPKDCSVGDIVRWIYETGTGDLNLNH